MSAFRFRLQPVLDLREQKQAAIAVELAQALNVEQDARAQLEDLRATRRASAEQATSGGQTRSIGELANLVFVMEQLDGHIASANDAVEAASENVQHVTAALTEAFQERRVLDRLRERHEEEHRTSAEQDDQKVMDAIAMTRYHQNESQ